MTHGGEKSSESAILDRFKSVPKQNLKRFDNGLTHALKEFDDGIFRQYEDYVKIIIENEGVRIKE